MTTPTAALARDALQTVGHAALDLSPLVGTRGLLTPLLSDVGNTLRPLAGRSGALGSVTVTNTTNGLLGTTTSPSGGSTSSKGLLNGLLRR